LSTDLPQDLPDNNAGGVTSSITVTDPDIVEDVNITFNITHPFDADIDMTMMSPALRSLFTDIGFTGNDFIDTTLDDEAPGPIPDSSSEAPFTGSYQPEGGPVLYVLDGQPAAGTYTLKVADDKDNDTGTFESWSVTIESLTFPERFDGRAEDGESLSSGICAIWNPEDGRTNLNLVVDPFTPGDKIVRYSVELANPSANGEGTIMVADCAGNTCAVPITLSGLTGPPAAEPGGPACSVPGDCTGAYEGADCVGGICYVPKNRHLSIDPTTNENAVAYQVEITEATAYPTAVGKTWWVDEPVCYDYPNGFPVPGATECSGSDYFGWVSRLSSTPVTRVWTEVPVNIADCATVPVVTYQVRASGDDGLSFSDPLEINTAHLPQGGAQTWGDLTGGPVDGMPGLWLAPERVTNLADVQAGIRTFENRTEDTGFPPRVWVDMEINQVVNFGDIDFMIKAFAGLLYADIEDLEFIGVDPADCP
jgi:subtilisin-like proprotein convertase family protein